MRIRGSGGYIVADLTEDEKNQRLGGEYFIGALGRIDENRITSYYCNICNKEFDGSPIIKFEKLDKDVEGVTLIEEGEYTCKECNSVIGTYKKFGDTDEVNISSDNELGSQEPNESDETIPLNRFIGMNIFDDNARSLGVVDDICLKGNKLILRIRNDAIRDIEWDKIIAINDIVLIKSQSNACSNCNYVNKEGAKFCEQCGSQL